MYTFVKFIHIATAALSITGFSVRGYLKIIGSPVINRSWVRIAPHIIDTALLVSAIILAIQLAQTPFVHAWLTAKVIALLVYILLGFMVMRLAKRQVMRISAYILALITFFYIVSVALSRSVVPFL